MTDKSKFGSIGWHDLTVENAAEIKDFYHEVVGWDTEPVNIDGYNDYNVNKPGDGQCVGGICHARGGNADLPPQWLMYITVEDIELSIEKCNELGGKIIAGPKLMGDIGIYCVMQDPAGAVCALWQDVE